MKKALEVVFAEHKKRTRELKDILLAERSSWDEERKRLKRTIEELQQENDMLKKAAAMSKRALPQPLPSKPVVLDLTLQTQLVPGKEEQEEEEQEEVWKVVQIGDDEGVAVTGSNVHNGHNGGGGFKYVESVRGKAAREALPEADDCRMCREYYDALAQETGVSRSKLIKTCTRHRSLHPQVGTPPGYWDVGFK